MPLQSAKRSNKDDPSKYDILLSKQAPTKSRTRRKSSGTPRKVFNKRMMSHNGAESHEEDTDADLDYHQSLVISQRHKNSCTSDEEPRFEAHTATDDSSLARDWGLMTDSCGSTWPVLQATCGRNESALGPDSAVTVQQSVVNAVLDPHHPALPTTPNGPGIMNSKKAAITRQQACDDEGFEEVNLNADFDCPTPINELDVNNDHGLDDFPIPSSWNFSPSSKASTRLKGPTRSKSLNLSGKFAFGQSGFTSSGTDASSYRLGTRSNGTIHLKPWLLTERSETGEEDDAMGSGERTPTSLADTRPSLVERTRTPSLVDELLSEIYARFPDVCSAGTGPGSVGGGSTCSMSDRRRRRSYYDSSTTASRRSGSPDSDCLTEYSTTSEPTTVKTPLNHLLTSCLNEASTRMGTTPSCLIRRDSHRRRLSGRGISELKHEVRRLETQIQYSMSQLTRQVKRRDRLRHRKERQYNFITAILQASSQKRSQDTRIRFSLEPFPGDPGYVQWKDAMKQVAKLPEGIPTEFRRKLWLTLSDKHLTSRGVDWPKAERFCFNEWSNPDDDELGLQIVRDLHRTGCSLFCGEDAAENQLMLKRVLLAYARWNKSIGYCQGFNMLAALILEVMEKSESDALKVMIFMIEGILPECYFTNNLRGLSIDMAVFRDLLKLRLPKLSKHLDELQRDAREVATGTSYEPPLTNVFTMQWFLTLFSTCLPRQTVLRVWDLILLEGNEVLLRTALAIWKGLEERILLVTTADEFYCSMGQLSGEMLEFSTDDSNRLIKTLVEISPFPFSEVSELREKYTYNITPWSQGLAVAKRGLKILYSDDEDNMDEDEEKIAVAATFGISAVFKSPRSPGKAKGKSSGKDPPQQSQSLGPSGTNVDKDRLTVDISALKKQYSKLRQRQKQAQIILSSAMTKDTGLLSSRSGPSSSSGNPVPLNHLLLGKKPLITSRPRRGPPPGAVPPPARPPKIKSLPKTSSQSSTTADGPGGDTKLNPTHIARPQPEIVSPDLNDPFTEERKRKNGVAKRLSIKSREGIKLKRSPNNSMSETSPKSGGKVNNNYKSSSTELCCGSDDDVTENATDIEDIPKDKVPIIEAKQEVKSENELFIEELMEDMELGPNNKTFIDYEDDTSAFVERKMPASSANSQKAIQIIKENSEILDKILRKKAEGKDSLFDSHSVASSTNASSLSSFDAGGETTSSPPKIGNVGKSLSVSSTSTFGRSMSSGSGVSRPITFNPFPKPVMRKKNEVGKKLGLY